jgi:hypothetical protein
MGLLDDAIREHLELKRRRGADAGELSRAESEALGPVRRAPDGTPDLSAIPPPAEASEPADLPPVHDDEPGWDEDRTAILPATPPPAYEPSAAYEPPAAAYEPPPIPAAPAPVDPGYAMPPALGGVDPGYALPPLGDDEHPPGFEHLDEEPPLEQPQLPPRERPRLRLRRRRSEADPEPTTPPPAFDEHDPPTAPHERPAAYEPPSPPPYQPPPPQRQQPPAAEPAGEDLLEETPEFLEETPDHDRLWFEQRPPRDFDFDK